LSSGYVIYRMSPFDRLEMLSIKKIDTIGPERQPCGTRYQVPCESVIASIPPQASQRGLIHVDWSIVSSSMNDDWWTGTCKRGL
jgi:hypothetical protein